MLCGLAIYNLTIIDLPFPLALYKKLLHEKVSLKDLKGLSPTLAKYEKLMVLCGVTLSLINLSCFRFLEAFKIFLTTMNLIYLTYSACRLILLEKYLVK